MKEHPQDDNHICDNCAATAPAPEPRCARCNPHSADDDAECNCECHHDFEDKPGYEPEVRWPFFEARRPAANEMELAEARHAAQSFNAEANKWLQELMNTNALLQRAARIMRRDGFTALRGTLWNDGEGVEDIQKWDVARSKPAPEPSGAVFGIDEVQRGHLTDEEWHRITTTLRAAAEGLRHEWEVAHQANDDLVRRHLKNRAEVRRLSRLVSCPPVVTRELARAREGRDRAEARVATLEAALRDFVKKHDEIQPHLDGVFSFYAAHGMKWPETLNWKVELDAVRAAALDAKP